MLAILVTASIGLSNVALVSVVHDSDRTRNRLIGIGMPVTVDVVVMNAASVVRPCD